MKRSPDAVFEVPPAVVTVTFTVPEPAGEVTSILVDETIRSTFAAFFPNCTAGASDRREPVIVTSVLPAAGPVFGESFVTVGQGT